MAEETINSNVRIVVSPNKMVDISPNPVFNNWEIINVKNIETFTFPGKIKEIIEENEKNNFFPTNLSSVLVFETIGETLKEQENEPITIPSFIEKGEFDNEIINYPSGFISSRGTIMPYIYVPSRFFTMNGIGNVKGKSLDDTYSVDKNTYGQCFNWSINADTSEEQFYNISNNARTYGTKVENGNSSYISLTNAIINPDRMNRIYNLTINKEDIPPVYKEKTDIDEMNFIIGGKDTSDTTPGSAFAFCYKFNPYTDASTLDPEKEKSKIVLKHGTNLTFELPQSGGVRAIFEIENDKKTISSGVVENSKNSKLMKQIPKNINDTWNMVSFYPVWNGVAISGGIEITSSKDKKSKGAKENGFMLKADNNANVIDYCDPNPAAFEANSSVQSMKNIKVKKKNTKNEDVEINWGNAINVKTIQSIPSFAYTPLFFHKRLKFSYFIKDESSTDKLISSNINSGSEIKHYLCPIVFIDGDYSVSNYVEGKEIVIEEENKSGDDSLSEEKTIKHRFFRFDFDISADLYQRRGVEIFGFYHRVRTTYKSNSDITNSNGVLQMPSLNKGFLNFFNQNSSGKYNSVLQECIQNSTSGYYDWINFATQISTSRSPESSSGSISLDKYAMIGQFDYTFKQPVGEIKLAATGGNNNVYKMGEGKDSIESGKEITSQGSNATQDSTISDVFFTGIAMELSFQDSSSQDNFSISLYGIEKKLSDIKIVNAPYWDGDPLGDVIDCLSQIGNFHYNFQTGGEPSWMNGDKTPCPRSTEFLKPAIAIVMGTTVMEAIKMVCSKTNKTYFFDRFGILQIIDNNIYGIPITIATKISDSKPDHEFSSLDILDINLQPNFDNVHNQIVTVALQGKRNGEYSATEEDFMPLVKMTEVSKPTSANSFGADIAYPWQRFIVRNETAILTKSEINYVHEMNVAEHTHGFFAGAITIPGNAEVELFDVFTIDDSGIYFYITGISHSYSSSSRVWTTSIQATWIDPVFAVETLSAFKEKPTTI